MASVTPAEDLQQTVFVVCYVAGATRPRGCEHTVSHCMQYCMQSSRAMLQLLKKNPPVLINPPTRAVRIKRSTPGEQNVPLRVHMAREGASVGLKRAPPAEPLHTAVLPSHEGAAVRGQPPRGAPEIVPKPVVQRAHMLGNVYGGLEVEGGVARGFRRHRPEDLSRLPRDGEVPRVHRLRPKACLIEDEGVVRGGEDLLP